MPNDAFQGLDRSRFVYLAGDGLCEEICPDIFFAAEDGLFYVKDVMEIKNPANPRLRMATGLADVPNNLLDAVIEAAEECPGECIFLNED